MWHAPCYIASQRNKRGTEPFRPCSNKANTIPPPGSIQPQPKEQPPIPPNSLPIAPSWLFDGAMSFYGACFSEEGTGAPSQSLPNRCNNRTYRTHRTQGSLAPCGTRRAEGLESRIARKPRAMTATGGCGRLYRVSVKWRGSRCATWRVRAWIDSNGTGLGRT